MNLPAPLKVLIIDADKTARQACRQAFEAAGCSVAEATRGRIGVELAKRFAPSVIVLEWLLPDGSGELVLQELKLEALTAEIPVIIVSAVRPELAGLGARAAAAHVVKPVAAEHLWATIRQVWESRVRPRPP